MIIKASKILKEKRLNFSVVIVGGGGWEKDIKELKESVEEKRTFIKKQIELLENQIKIGRKELHELLKKSGITEQMEVEE